jgi:predicted nuclease with TOPRIM domain|tara:strand:+ start:282 stop:458 length:177 start_codon:yes stop_codon:yes gene_type:complete
MSDGIPNDLEDKIEYFRNQNNFLKEKIVQLTKKYQTLEHEYDRVVEENENLKTMLGKL